jgi:N-acetylglucosaminyldiphosphoundecaprenol N-acetyl-beta-D-mannosaminyltransferase
MTGARRRVRIGLIDIDAVRFGEALDAIADLVARRRGGSVFTPNVDHVVIAEHDPAFRDAYRQADLVFADGMPLIWASRLMGQLLPAKVSGSDLILPLAERGARAGWRFYLLGGAEGVAQAAAENIARRFGATVVGADAASLAVEADDPGTRAALGRIERSRPDVVLVALGAPKQEVWIHRHTPELRPAVAIGVGAGLDFVAGRVKRAPRWVSRSGLEWLWRLAREPRRLWRRYLVRDPEFLRIAWQAWRASRTARPRELGA